MAEIRCLACDRPLDELDILLAPAETPEGGRRCMACLDTAATGSGADGSPPIPAAGPAGHRVPPSGDAAAVDPPATDSAATVGVRELRNQVASIVRRAASGERLVVTVDGRPMAQIGPLAAPGAPSLADLAAAGLVEPPRTPTPATAPEAEDLPADVRLDQVLGELRGR